MSEHGRAFVASLHGTIHRPDCRSVKALKHPEQVFLTPSQVGGQTTYALAECCWRYGATRPSSCLVWSHEEADDV